MTLDMMFSRALQGCTCLFIHLASASLFCQLVCSPHEGAPRRPSKKENPFAGPRGRKAQQRGKGDSLMERSLGSRIDQPDRMDKGLAIKMYCCADCGHEVLMDRLSSSFGLCSTCENKQRLRTNSPPITAHHHA